jgi:putative protease
MELVCPAGNLRALRDAFTHGADAVYVGLRDETNARHFAGLNFSPKELHEACAMTRAYGKRLFLALNTYAATPTFEKWCAAAEHGAAAGVDAFIMADIGVMNYCRTQLPHIARHLSVQGSATNIAALDFYHSHFNVTRAVLPRVLSLKQIQQLTPKSPVDIEVFAFGSLCIMAEGRCYLSSYLTGESPNGAGICSPAKHVRWQESNKNLSVYLNNVLIDQFSPDEQAGYPTLCKGRFNTNVKQHYHALEEPVSLNTIELLPLLKKSGARAIKIEGRQRSPAYVAEVTKIFRAALNQLKQNHDHYTVHPDWLTRLSKLSEGTHTTRGAYERAWQ